MPNIKSAKKRVIVIATKTARNKANRSVLKTDIKKAYAAIESGAADKEGTEDAGEESEKVGLPAVGDVVEVLLPTGKTINYRLLEISK